MAKQWYYNNDGGQSGPVNSQQLRKLALDGQVSGEDLVWREGYEEWKPARDVTGLEFLREEASTSKTRSADASVGGQESGAKSAAPPLTPEPVVTPTSNTKAARSGSPAILVAVICGGLVLLCAVGAGAYMMGQSGDTPGASPATKETTVIATTTEPVGDGAEGDVMDRRTEKFHDELESVRDDLRDEIEELEETKDGLQKTTRELEQKKEELDKEIDRLVSRRDFINKWRNADFVMINPTHFSVAVNDTGNGLEVIEEAEGELAEATLGAARNWHIPRIGHDASLTRAVFEQSDAGGRIPAGLESQIRDAYWKPHRYVPYGPETETEGLELVVFRDLSNYDIRMGYSLEADRDGIDFYPIGTTPERVPFSKMQPGSARRGDVDEVLRSLTDVDFLEYCLLRVAQKVGSAGTANSMQSTARPAVLVHVNVDIPSDHADFYKSLDQQLIEQGRQPESIEASGVLGMLGFFADLAVRTSVPARRKALRSEMMRTDPHKRARHLSRYVEDEIMARLSRSGMSPVSNKDAELIASTGFNDLMEGASNHDATHLLLVTVKDPGGSGDYHLSMRLYREDGKEVWTDQGDRVLDTAGVGSQFHMVSGRPAMLYLKEDSFKDFTGMESPPAMPLAKIRSGAERYSHLVYLESEPDAAEIMHRPLYQKDIFRTPVEQFATIRPVETIDDIPQEFILRHVVNEVASTVLPPAGRVIQVSSQSAIVALGQKQGVRAGDRLRVIRVQRKPVTSSSTSLSRSSFGLLANGESLLPTELTVAEAAANQSRVTVNRTGFEQEWPENVPLSENDLVITKATGTRVVSVEIPELVAPIPLVITKLGLNTKPLVRQKFEADARQTAVQVAELTQSGLGALGIPVLRQERQTGSRLGANRESSVRKATHRVHGTITLSPKINTSARSAARPVYRLELKISPVGSTEVLRQFDFDLKDVISPSVGEGRR